MVLSRCRSSVTYSMNLLFVPLHRTIFTSCPSNKQNPGRDNLLQCNFKIQELGRLGRITEARKLFDELLQRDKTTWNTMIIEYSQNGKMNDARALFDVFKSKSQRTWTAMISGYAGLGRIEDARKLFNSMPNKNVNAWNAMISGYIRNGYVIYSRKLFDEMPEKNVISWNSMITCYCNWGLVTEAQKLFDKMPEKNLVSWLVLISGYVHTQDYQNAWQLFSNMYHSGLMPDQAIFAITLTAITRLNYLALIKIMHLLAIKTNFDNDVVVSSAILNAYGRDGTLDFAFRFFENIPQKSEYSWSSIISALSHCGKLDDAIALYEKVPQPMLGAQNAMLSCYAQNGRVDEAKLLFDQICKPDIVSWNAILTAYTQNGKMEAAVKIFENMPMKNSVSWAVMIAGYSQNGMNEHALELFSELFKKGVVPTCSCLTSALFACSNIPSLPLGRQLHALIIKRSKHLNLFVGNGLITMYAKCKSTQDICQVFLSMRSKDIVSWNSLVMGLSKNSLLDETHNIFARMPERDNVSWASIIYACVQAGHLTEAFNLFFQMINAGNQPNSSSLTTLLNACTNLGMTKVGQQLHGLAFKLDLDTDIFVGNALIDMYSKCGCVEGFFVFDEMPERDLISWNSVLTCCDQHGFGKEAINIFNQMNTEDIHPDSISFLCLLSACSHAGLVSEGHKFFHSMIHDYGLTPSGPHYACLVDFWGQVGKCREAESFIKQMPIDPEPVVWTSLLRACRIHQNIDVGKRVAETLFLLEPQNSDNYALLCNIYSSLGLWDEAERMKKVMEERGVAKEQRFSWIEIKNKFHCFLTGEKNHEQSEVYPTVSKLYLKLREMYPAHNKRILLHDEEDMEVEVLYHSEKLAIVCGLLNTPPGSPLHIVTNHQICDDCHTFAKFVSNTAKREIIIRVQHRFHHFLDGLCSCRDYW